MEIIVSIFFFSLASAVCVNLFAKAHLLSKTAVEQNNAVLYSQNLAELFTACDGELSEMQQLEPTLLEGNQGNNLYLIFDRNWNSLREAGEVAYAVILTKQEEETKRFAVADIQVCAVQPMERIETAFGEKDLSGRMGEMGIRELYRIEVRHYCGRKG